MGGLLNRYARFRSTENDGLALAAGHLQTVIRMIEVGEPCDRIMEQINAVQATLQRVEIQLAVAQYQKEREVLLTSKNPDELVQTLHHVLTLYQVMSKHVT